MKKVIVTGAGGFIGSALVKKLLNNGITVYGVDISAENMDKINCSVNFIPVVADFSKYEKLHNMINDSNIDVFYHFAWQGGFASDILKDYKIQLNNAGAACEAVNQAIKKGCKKFVFAGTCNEYELIPYLKTSNIKPRYTCVYSSAKMAAELIGKTYSYNNKMAFCGGLIAMPYGENNRAKNLPNIVISQLSKNISPKLIEGNTLYDLVYIDDVVGAFISIGENGHDMKSYYIGHRKLRTFKDIITEIGTVVNPNINLQFGAFKDAASIDYSLIDLDALYNDTGFECKADFKESILKTAEWVKTLNWEEK